MKFRRNGQPDEPEINLIPLIDVLLVIIIFLMLTTTYSRFSGLEINLPTADTESTDTKVEQIDVAVTAGGQVVVNRVPVAGGDVTAIAQALTRAVPSGAKEPIVVIDADAKTTHQRVVDVMQAAQQAGLEHMTFATRPADR